MYKFVCFVGLLLLISCCKEHEAVKPVVIGGAQGGAGIPEGAVNGLFSVGEGRVVCFSRGNLQYQASTGTWRFAEQQHQYIGYSNSDIAADYNGWIDLLGWGTSGWDGAGASCQPWSSSDDYSTYGPVGEFNLTGDYSNADWGVYCAIANGGGKAGLWRTLSREEWDYLFFSRAEAAGLADWWLDPGFGFSKTVAQNYELLRALPLLRERFGRPMLVGVSRKSFIYKPLGITAAESLSATQLVHMSALQGGADILRVHDVAEAVRTVKLYRLL